MFTSALCENKEFRAKLEKNGKNQGDSETLPLGVQMPEASKRTRHSAWGSPEAQWLRPDARPYE